ncbi:hypothetical protein ACFSOZ_30740 [Mesorhizobium newzealandense]|uniref:Uncharacterized protein n=1 Tax=Mesorhizobium newzealandense TaxID=1300302 RepID=A0ABW4UH24_9HYPH
MHNNGVVDSDQLAMLKTILDEHCQSSGIEADSLDREGIASRLLALFMSGVTGIEDLKQALSDHRFSA